MKFSKNYIHCILYADNYFIVKPSHLICKLLFYYKEYFSLVVKNSNIWIKSLKPENLKISY